MAQLTNAYPTPVYLNWADESIVGGHGTSNSKLCQVGSGGKTAYLSWQSTCITFQVQWRTRRRYSPSKAATVNPSGVDVWEDWSDWQGSNLSEDAASSTTIAWSNVRYLNTPFTFAYSFGDYDRTDYQFRVRVIDESTLTCSEWAYESMTVVYQPQMSYTDATPRADGGVDLTVTTNWPRGWTLWFGDFRKDTYYGKIIGGLYTRYTSTSAAMTITIPAKCIMGNKFICPAAASLTTSDNGNITKSDPFTVGAHTPPASIADPVVTFEDTNEAVVVNVKNSNYTSVSVSAQWDDCYGQSHLEELEVAGNWVALFRAAPYDVEVTYRVAVATDAGWKSVELMHTLDAKGRMSWLADDGSYVELVYNMSRNTAYEPEGEQVKCAGRDVPVARLGSGGERKITASGDVVSPKYGVNSAWLPEVELLRSNRTWLWRSPLGERVRVVVTSVSESAENGAQDVTVDVSMTEVA